MNMFLNNRNNLSDLNKFQKKYLSEIKKIKPDKPFTAWNNFQSAEYEGLFACGWTKDDNLLLVNYNGYKLIDPASGFTLEEDNQKLSYEYMSSNNLNFKYNGEEDINIFGIYGGRGNLVTKDGWVLDILYPYWPNCIVALKRPTKPNEITLEIWQGINLIKLETLEYNNLNCGFSNNEQFFVISGSFGVEIYGREK